MQNNAIRKQVFSYKNMHMTPNIQLNHILQQQQKKNPYWDPSHTKTILYALVSFSYKTEDFVNGKL